MKKFILIIIILCLSIPFIYTKEGDIPFKDFIGKNVEVYFINGYMLNGKLIEVTDKYLVIDDISDTIYIYKDFIAAIEVSKKIITK